MSKTLYLQIFFIIASNQVCSVFVLFRDLKKREREREGFDLSLILIIKG